MICDGGRLQSRFNSLLQQNVQCDTGAGFSLKLQRYLGIVTENT